MSVARIHTVKHARQTYEKVAKIDESGQQVVTPVKSKRTGEQRLSRKGRPITRRIRVADKSKPKPLLKCGKCGDEIALGAPYRWFTVGFRSHYKQVRCMKGSCTPRESERESSGIRSEILGAIEAAHDELNALTEVGDASEVESIVQQVGDAFRTAADQYREADEAFGGGGNTENGDRADTSETGAGELESWSTSGDNEPDYEDCEDDLHKPVEERADEEDDRPIVDKGDSECENCVSIRNNWFSDLIDEASEAIDNVEQP
jgi:hypothetical protein